MSELAYVRVGLCPGWLMSGLAYVRVGLGAVHKVCHALGGGGGFKKCDSL